MVDIFDRIEFEDDGIYCLVDYKKNNPKGFITDLIKIYNIQEVNHIQIENDINDKKEKVLITRDIDAININERIEVIISNDKFVAEAKFYPPIKNGKLLTKKDILEEVYNLNITFGLNLKFIDDFIDNRDYEKVYIVAEGIYPQKGKDGFLEYCVDINEKKIKPKILEDGTIDYKSLNLFEPVLEGTILAIQVEAINGENGKNIYGDIVVSEEVNPPPDLPKGKNTEISSDGKRLISTINGYVIYEKNLVNVLPILEIKSDINNSTGNIDFVGRVIVRGNVLSGFTINAEGDIDIYGWVEGATIISEGNIFIEKGIQGANKAKIVANKNISLNFVENATLIAEGDISASSIMNCSVLCNGNVSIIGKRGLMLGGKAIIGKDLIAKDIGSNMSNNTEITVGVNYKVLNKYEELVKLIDSLSQRYNSLDKIVEKLSKMDINYLSDEKRALFEKSVKERLEIKRKILKCKNDLKIIIPFFTNRMGKIKVLNNLYGGTKIVANNAIIFIKDDIKSCTLQNVEGKVKVFR
ncbi:FapA family protein [uncultured Tyzzerella sp.]|uniref:DUF342 domain-containing protein n=1 Tax=uncultured Tyzzerella sp. TaxID=2321398 RepID=UPI0029431A69|nr:FapA family protein [uncultured Tyzzerella sp.]